jgi:LacI family transcriptional regulator
VHPSAFFCVTDDLAIEMIRRSEGLVPDKTSIVGLDGSPRAEDFDLTTVEQPMEDIGRMAVDVLLDEIEGRAKELTRVEVLPELVVRGSTAKIS